MDEIVKRSLKGVVQTLVDRLLFFAVLSNGTAIAAECIQAVCLEAVQYCSLLEIEGMKRDALRFIAQTRTGIQSSLIDRKRGPL